MDYFDGLTFFPQPNKGVWKASDIIYHDEIVMYRVVTSKPGTARRFLKRLKEKLKIAFKQEEIFIVTRKVELL